MKIALIGATGFIGSAILREALNRGHQVTGIVRHPENLPQHPNLVAQRGDVRNETETPALVVGHDAVISAYSPGRDVETDPPTVHGRLLDKHSIAPPNSGLHLAAYRPVCQLSDGPAVGERFR